MDKKEAIEIIKEAVKGNARKEDFFKTPNEIIGDVLDEYAKAIEQLFALCYVSQQREQFKAYTKWLNDKIRDSDELDELIDDYFSSL